jgi:hypothetical protein
VGGGGQKEKVKESKYGGCYFVLLYENRKMKETVLRRGEE